MLKVNGVVKQDGDLNQMIWNVPETIWKLSEIVELAAGDIIMTGTPAGVGQVNVGDKIECDVEGISSLSVTIGKPKA
jgi:fumarylpyruvate hydrolase